MSPNTGSPPSWQQRLRDGRGRSYWARCTREFIHQMRSASPSEQRSALKNYANWIHYTAGRRADIRPTLLVSFTTEFARLAKVLGEPGDAGIIDALDRAIELTQSIGRSTAQLKLAKAACYGALVNEHEDRRSALVDAVDTAAEGGPVWAEAMLNLCQYYADTSHYDHARSVIKRFRDGVSADSLARRYECAASVYEGYIKVVSMRDLAGAERNFERALTFQEMADHDATVAMWISMAYYQRGRLRQMRQNYTEAIANYRLASQVRSRWAHDFRTFAFINLRIAESYTAVLDLDAAERHLQESADSSMPVPTGARDGSSAVWPERPTRLPVAVRRPGSRHWSAPGTKPEPSASTEVSCCASAACSCSTPAAAPCALPCGSGSP